MSCRGEWVSASMGSPGGISDAPLCGPMIVSTCLFRVSVTPWFNPEEKCGLETEAFDVTFTVVRTCSTAPHFRKNANRRFDSRQFGRKFLMICIPAHAGPVARHFPLTFISMPGRSVSVRCERPLGFEDLDKGKPVARRGRKAMGLAAGEIARPPKGPQSEGLVK